MPNNKEHSWYIESFYSATTRVIMVYTETYKSDVMCDDKQKHDLWTCPGNRIQVAVAELKKTGLNFKIFLMVNCGKIKEITPQVFERILRKESKHG